MTSVTHIIQSRFIDLITVKIQHYKHADMFHSFMVKQIVAPTRKVRYTIYENN